MKLTLTRIGSYSYLLALLALSAAGAGGYFVISSLLAAYAQQGTTITAKAGAGRVNGLIAHYRSTLEGIARRTEIADAFAAHDTQQLATLAGRATAHIPYALRVRLLPIGYRRLDTESVPQLAYACLDLLDRREKKLLVPDAELHLANTPSAHIDITQPVYDRDNVLRGHVLASLDPAVLKTAIDAATVPAGGYLELRQYAGENDYIALAASGDATLASGVPADIAPVANSAWRIVIWPGPLAWRPSTTELAASATSLLLALLFLALAVALPQRTINRSLRHDISLLAGMFADIRAGTLSEKYPFRLDEFRELSVQLRRSGQAIIQDRMTLEQIAQRDSLTQLASRAAFDLRLDQLLGQARMGFPSSLLLVDIDGLKRINEEFGHEAGDTLIKRFSQALKEALRQSDFLARLEGGRFGVIFPFTDLDSISGLAERLRDTLPEQMDLGDGRSAIVQWSGGLTALTAGDRKVQAAAKRAEQALREAKEAGGGRTATILPVTEPAPSRPASTAPAGDRKRTG